MTLQDIEKSLASLPFQNPVSIRLSKNFQKNFFKETWLGSLIANAALSSGHLTIRDWTNANSDELQELFGSTLLRLLAAFMAESVEDQSKKKISIDVHEIIEQIIYHKRGVFEQVEGGEKSYSFVSVDAGEDDKSGLNMPRPLVLAAGEKREFVEKFLRIKRERIDQVFGLSLQASLFEQTFDREKELATLIYELYENTNQHGRFDEQNRLIKGIRSFNIKRHIGRHKDILNQAGSFEQLRAFVERFPEHELKFYEISIADNGSGIIRRFLSSRPDYKDDPVFKQASSFEKLNYIIERSLSSKLFAGSGKGIRTALSIVGALGGFLTLRTNDCWVYYDGKRDDGQPVLQPVTKNFELGDIRGTFYNILLPVSNPAP